VGRAYRARSGGKNNGKDEEYPRLAKLCKYQKTVFRYLVFRVKSQMLHNAFVISTRRVGRRVSKGLKSGNHETTVRLFQGWQPAGRRRVGHGRP
jgi:hypothetical protein